MKDTAVMCELDVIYWLFTILWMLMDARLDLGACRENIKVTNWREMK